MSVGPLIISLAGKELLDKEKQLLKHKNVGGLVLFRENYDENANDPKSDLKKLIQQVRAINPNIVIMVDHEGGLVWRFKKGFTKLPAAKEYGTLYSEALKLEKEAIVEENKAKENNDSKLIAEALSKKEKAIAKKKEVLEKVFDHAQTMAKELLECGIDMSLAPVIDLDGPSNVIGKYNRAFHSDPEVVVIIAEHFIRGMNKAGMLATPKHFPDHGTCVLDSHIAKPKDDRSISELEKGLIPYRKLIANKDLKIGTVMTNFVTYPSVDADNIAAFSPIWNKVLRMPAITIEDQVVTGANYQGVIVSDCLHMAGADVGAQLERLQAAAKTNDFLMYTHQHNSTKGNKLDDLLKILDQIPDTKEAAERRAQLLKKLNRKLSMELSNMLTGYQTSTNTSPNTNTITSTNISTNTGNNTTTNTSINTSTNTNKSSHHEGDEKNSKPYSVL